MALVGGHVQLGGAHVPTDKGYIGQAAEGDSVVADAIDVTHGRRGRQRTDSRPCCAAISRLIQDLGSEPRRRSPRVGPPVGGVEEEGVLDWERGHRERYPCC